MTFLPPFVLVYTQMFFHLCTHDTTTTPFSSFYGFLFLPFLYSLLKLALSFFFSSSTLVTVSLFIVFKKHPLCFLRLLRGIRGGKGPAKLGGCWIGRIEEISSLLLRIERKRRMMMIMEE